MTGQYIAPQSKEQLFHSICSLAKQYSTGVAILDACHPERPFVYYNESFAVLTGYTDDELIGRNLSQFVDTNTATHLLEALNDSLEHALPFETSLIHYQKDSTPFWHEMFTHPIRDRHGSVQYIMLHSKDVTDEKLFKILSKLEHEVYSEIEKGGELSSILQLISTQIETYYIRNIYCAIHLTQANETLATVASGSMPIELAHAMLLSNARTSTVERVNSQYVNDVCTTLQMELKMPIHAYVTKIISDQNDQTRGAITLYFAKEPIIKQIELDFLDRLILLISLAVKYVAQTQQLRKLAYYDQATDLPNVHYFHTQLSTWINEGKRGVVSIIQPGEYSNIVDLYGRQAGDEILRQMAERLQQSASSERHEFIAKHSHSTLIFACNYEMDELELYHSRLRQIIQTPYIIQDKELHITLKVGVTHFKEDEQVDEIIRQADLTLSKSRQISGTNVAYFEEQNNVKLQKEMDILNQLTYGLTQQEFYAVLQPKINFNTLEIEGFEALCRWNNNVLGHVSPDTFIPIAERTGKIKKIDSLVLKQVLAWQQQRLANGEKTLPIAINISPVYFYDEQFVENIISLIEQYNVPPHLIKLEVTESVELVDFSKAKAILASLKQHGIESSIDDFGVGFSSPSYLQQLPFREIKIDRSFINEMDKPEMYAVVQTIIHLAASLRMNAVAEGIETAQQFENLRKMGCSTGQGYFFYKPLALSEAANLVNKI